MPYIITTTTSRSIQSRCTVTTRTEAVDALHQALHAQCHPTVAYNESHSLGFAGSRTVHLPDGTVIEVERVPEVHS